MKRFLSHIISGILGLLAAYFFVPGFHIGILPDSSFFGIALTAAWQLFLILGIILGLLNFFVKPVLQLVTLPLRFITLGLFGIVVNMATLWAVDLIFQEVSIPWFWPLFWATLIVWAVRLIFSTLLLKNDD